ncbi:MAG: S-methyl-5'-thioadenosine phosphorylase [Candidatus Omnitrophica bacterium]|nr:S-methyl-5'-thioadenosine phosphorylase [Candidatus Omnitrophota bacterium]MDD5500231.1 S-methyl-5'-thioadenosine phosphorylase [Candidatus Omnitrophota bacterium]
MMSRIGIIGGSGLYEMEGIKVLRRMEVKTPFGRPSDKFTLGEMEGREVVFLPRHGIGHRISPSGINYRANIFAMKKLGVGRIISVAACGSLKEEIKPLDFVVVDQFVDRTNHARQMSFFQEGIVSHIVFSHPVCGDLSAQIYEAGRELNMSIHRKGTYINMEGPQFSTLAESRLYRSWGMDVIGMTNMAEARLCREAEICYATLACITDYDCWYPGHESVTLEMVLENSRKNIENAKKIVATVIRKLSPERTCSCGRALEAAIVTDKEMIPAKARRDLKIIIGKYLK